MQETKFVKERINAILEDMKTSIPYAIVAEKNGVAARTLFEWLARGRKELADNLDTNYARFAVDVKNIEFNVLKRHINEIENKADKWQANAWMLERRWQKYYSSSAALIEIERRITELEEQGQSVDISKEDLVKVKEDVRANRAY
jgi:NDP-sugar pyrophosphorylase family protein